MAAFSVHQVRQLYVANAYKENLAALKDAGDITVAKTNEGDAIYFQYMGALLDKMRSDLIKIENITNLRATRAEDIATKLKGYTLTLDPNINGGQPVAGQDYILRLAFREFIGMSEADQYFKYGMVHVFPGLKASDFYKEMALSLAANISKDVTALVDIYLYDGATETKVEEGVDPKSLTGTYTALRIAEAVQPWHLGTMPQAVIPFSVQPTTVLVDGDQRIWGEVESYDTKAVLPEGQLIADLEYFCMGERGDQYRNMGWPNVIPTKYLVDPSKMYDVINIHYFYQGDGISVQKSEKDIQIVVPRPGEKDYSNINAVIAAIKTLVPGEPSMFLQELS
jgi:hypothetical protein